MSSCNEFKFSIAQRRKNCIAPGHGGDTKKLEARCGKNIINCFLPFFKCYIPIPSYKKNQD